MGKIKCDRELFRKLLCEFTGTAMLLALGCTLSVGIRGDELGIGWGLVYTIVLHTFAFLCGAHVNPSVSICATILGHMDWALMLLYILMQFLGSFLGFGLAYAVTPRFSGDICLTVTGGVKEWKMLLVEFMLISILLLTFCSIWDKRNAGGFDSLSVRVGFVIAGLFYAGHRYTGSSMNFVRTFAPGVVQLEFKGMWTYFVAHMLGAVLVPLLWRFVLAEKSSDTPSEATIATAK
ncbi:lens fiber major intrinsic protein-like [Scaptodrosophila lebanonensis]|uniref:Lens fiber major intrinsic protein-like n=1 Tax=Drosophila lebanonensis TaxID=7225 RepID=A0A6J2TYG6_DROLE|nr:lens fiber major intrinsic protein-like [Scaptodrosophila lebanonensis]